MLASRFAASGLSAFSAMSARTFRACIPTTLLSPWDSRNRERMFR